MQVYFFHYTVHGNFTLMKRIVFWMYRKIEYEAHTEKNKTLWRVFIDKVLVKILLYKFFTYLCLQ